MAGRPARGRGRPHGPLPEGERSDTWLTYSEQKHHVHLSHAYTTLGDTARAHESQQRALQLSAPTSTMTRTLLHIDAAACSPASSVQMDAGCARPGRGTEPGGLTPSDRQRGEKGALLVGQDGRGLQERGGACG
ncbi:hypothetical protein GCM10010313_26890 [Streptomyces violarus]|nr:hypothetical protein GCM10010313_26890 [Streptomyces violarus]